MILVVGMLIGLPLKIGIWLPDLVSAPLNTLAEEWLTSGHIFRVVQYWNRVDFYSTDLHIVSPDGYKVVHVLDGDDNKSWHLPMTVDGQNHTVTVILSGNRERRVIWK